MLFPYQCNCLCWKIAITRLHWILLCWMWQVPLAWHWESDHHGAPSCVIEILCAQWKQCDPLGVLFYIVENVEKKLCIAVVTAIVMALRSLIKTESRTAKLRQVESQSQGFTGKWTSEWMNSNPYTLLFCSLPVCPFLIFSFQVVFFWEKILQHDFAWCLSIPCWLSSFKVLESEKKRLKENSNISYIFVKSFCLPINAKKNLRGNTFFCEAYVYLLELQLKLNSQNSFHLYRSLSLF